ncbi:hypothetical protein E2C01_097407 [Portunus trituberculatus]|uniref:Uncharacterized protein n=1 Tax=Portunus trituberculatus TaxID=210409 RepID=A0A5B7JYF7_PORTR|nr:hypothetical protein [Portunus trituberculatus]
MVNGFIWGVGEVREGRCQCAGDAAVWRLAVAGIGREALVSGRVEDAAGDIISHQAEHFRRPLQPRHPHCAGGGRPRLGDAHCMTAQRVDSAGETVVRCYAMDTSALSSGEKSEYNIRN